MKSKFLAISLILLAFAIRIAGILSQSLWRDEVDAVLFASAPFKEVLDYFTRPGWNGPLYYLLLKGWLNLAGKGEFALRYFSLLFGVLSLPLIFRMAKRFLPSPWALVAMLLSCFSPYLVWYSQEGKMYGLWLFLSTLAFNFHLNALEKGGLKRWLLYLAAVTVCLYVHLHSLFMVLSQLVLYLWPGYRMKWREGIAIHLLLVLPFVPVIRWLLPAFLAPNPSGFPYYPLWDMIGILFTGWSCGILSTLWPWSLIPAGFAVLGGLLERRKGLLFLSLILTPTLGLFSVCLKKPVFTDRYLIFLAPSFYALLTLGVRFWQTKRRFFGPLLLAGLILIDIEGLWSQSHFPIKSDFRAAVALFKEYAQEGDIVVFQIPYVRRVFDYYLAGEKVYIPVDGPYTNWGMTPEQVNAYLERHIGSRRRVWLVLSEAEMWDSRGLTEEWFEGKFRPMIRGHFVRVKITLYSRPGPLLSPMVLRYKCFLPLVLR